MMLKDARYIHFAQTWREEREGGRETEIENGEREIAIEIDRKI